MAQAASSARTCRVTAGWVMPSREAAREKLSSRATASKARHWLYRIGPFPRAGCLSGLVFVVSGRHGASFDFAQDEAKSNLPSPINLILVSHRMPHRLLFAARW